MCVIMLHAQECYGNSDAAAVARVKEVYRDLDLERVFKEYEAESHTRLSEMIHSQTMLPAEVFVGLLNKIYKRSK